MLRLSFNLRLDRSDNTICNITVSFMTKDSPFSRSIPSSLSSLTTNGICAASGLVFVHQQQIIADFELSN
jgi:hypothetical protein